MDEATDDEAEAASATWTSHCWSPGNLLFATSDVGGIVRLAIGGGGAPALALRCSSGVAAVVADTTHLVVGCADGSLRWFGLPGEEELDEETSSSGPSRSSRPFRRSFTLRITCRFLRRRSRARRIWSSTSRSSCRSSRWRRRASWRARRWRRITAAPSSPPRRSPSSTSTAATSARTTWSHARQTARCAASTRSHAWRWRV